MAVIGREPHALPDGGTFATGNYRFRYCKLPICRTEGMLVSLSKKRRTLLCSDLFHHMGEVEPLTFTDVVGRSGFRVAG